MIDAQTPGAPDDKALRLRCLAAFVSVLLLAFQVAQAQSPLENPPVKLPEGDTIAPPVFVGLFAGLANSFHRTSIDDEIACDFGTFSSASARHLPFGLFFDFPSVFGPSVRFLTHFSRGSIAVVIPGSRFRFEHLQPGSDTVTVAESLTELHATLGITTLAFGATYEIPGVGIRVGASQSITAITSSTERRTERYTAPADVRFPETNSPVREIAPTAPVLFRDLIYGGEISIGYRLRAGRRLTFFPQVRGAIAYTSIAGNESWSLVSVTPTLAVGFDLSSDVQRPALPPPDPPQPIDTTPKLQLPVLAATVVAKGVDADGREYDDPAIEIQEAPWVEVVPLLPSVFFDRGSAVIPRRYSRLERAGQAEAFSVDSLVNVTPVDIHWQILNIIGSRMRADGRITAKIVGAGSLDEGADVIALGASRASSVAEYLRKVWGIDSARLLVSSNARPTPASNEERPEGREENRRVELRFNMESAVEPVVIHRLAAVASPPAVRFQTDITADTALAGWNVTVTQGEKELLRFEGNSAAGSLEQSKLWPLTDLRVNRDLTPIRYRLQVTDVIGQRASDSGTFRVVERVTRVGGDTAAGRVELFGYNLVGFDYDSAELHPRQLAELREIARSASGQAQMTIVGYTDRVGDPERNRLLSLARANAVAEAVRAEQRRLAIPAADAVSIQGLGQRGDLFDNDLPEGRILSRMAVVTISKLRLK